MHELGIVFHVIKMVEEVGEKNSLTSVARVGLALGEVSGVLPDYLQDCWKWAVQKSDLLRDSVLDVRRIDAVTVCNACGKTYGTVAHGKVCPHCGSADTVLLRSSSRRLRPSSPSRLMRGRPSVYAAWRMDTPGSVAF